MMRNILALIGAATVTFLGAGWYLGWYNISAKPSENGRQINFQVHPEKVGKSIKEGVEIASEVKSKLSDKGEEGKPPPLTTPGQQGPAAKFLGLGKSDEKNSKKPTDDDDDRKFFGNLRRGD